MMYQQRTAAAGFTLIELMISIGIISMLLGGIYVFYSNVQNTAKVRSTMQTLTAIKTQLEQYQTDKDEYPPKLSDLVPLYLTKLPKDGWSNEFKYRPTPSGAHPYELYSYGPNGPGSDKKEQLSVSWK